MSAGSDRVVVAGGGQAGFQVAASLRQAGYPGEIAIICAEARLPYQRPPLSKAYIKTAAGFDSLMLRPEAFFETNRIGVTQGRRVTAIDRPGKAVVLDDGKPLDYSHLVIATGARNRIPPITGVEQKGVFVLRSADEAEDLRSRLVEGSRLVIIGGGFIGLEVAASARSRNVGVVVLEAADRLMGRVVSPAISEFFLSAHRAMGTEVVLGAKIARITGEGTASGVELTDGTLYPADSVLVATGVLPNAELAAEAGLATKGGVLVDSFMTTDDPAIFAIGDCAAFESPFAQGLVRLESVQNAVDQAKCVAARIMGGAAPYRSVPWFWSDQGAFKLQMVGITTGADFVHLAGSPAEGRLVAYCFRGDTLLGIETVNRPGEHMLGRKILADNLRVLKDHVSAADFDLKRHIAELGTA